MTPSHRIVLCFVLLGLISNGACQLRAGQRDRSRGTFLGYFETLEHDVAGAVWALDDEWLHVEGFTYDGRGPDAFFWVGTEGDQASPRGHIVPFPSGASGEREMVLPAFSGENVLFRLPDGVKVSQLRWISVWCRRFTVNFGSFRVPQNLVLPKKRKLAELSRLAHAVRSGNVTLLDSKTIYIPNLHYDGLGPDAYFWVGKGVPDRSGRKIPNEKKSLNPLEAYEGVDIELVLPDNLTVYDIDYLALWCVKYTENFGDVKIPPAAELFLPPALGQTQVKSESELQPLQPGAKDQYHTTDEVYTTVQLPTTSEPATVQQSTITNDDIVLLNETTTQLPETVYPDDFSTNVTETGETMTVESLTEGLSSTEIMTQTVTNLDFVTEDLSVSTSERLGFSTTSENSVSSTSEISLETSTIANDEKTTEIIANMEQAMKENENELQRKGRQMPDKNMEGVSDDDKIGISNIGDSKQVMPSDFYLATPDGKSENTFRFGLAEDLNNITVFDTNNTQSISRANTSGVVLGDFGGMPNGSLSENEYTFKYDADPEIEPLSRNESEITEILVHEGDGKYRYSVGNDHVIQHVIDDVNFQPHGLVQIDSQKHSGAYFYGLPAHTDHESESLEEEHGHEEGHGHEENVMSKDHPKDVYSVPVQMNLTDSQSEVVTENSNGETGSTVAESGSTERPKEHVEMTEESSEKMESTTDRKEQDMKSKEKDTSKGVQNDTENEHGDQNVEEESETKEKVAESGKAQEVKESVAESKKAESAALPSCIPDLVVLIVGVQFAAWYNF